MKNLVAVAAVLALTLAGQCFAEDVDSSHDCKERGGQMENGHCMKGGVDIGTAGVAAPAAAASAAAGSVSAAAVVGVAAAVAIAVAVAVSSGNGGGNNTGTTGTTGTH